MRHGTDCEKAAHTGYGYLHDEDDDQPYDVDGLSYCGRCHTALMCREPRTFVPHRHCTETSGACFEQGHCLSRCTALKTKTHEARIRELERRLLALELLMHRKAPNEK